jgi:DNA-binding MarR family transcriptional regulator
MDEAENADDTLLPLRVWLALFSSVKQIETVVRRNLREIFASTLPRFDLLSQLYRTPDGLTMGELSARLMVTNGNVTGLINRLVSEGLVERIVDPADRRVQRVSLSRKGRRFFGSMAPANQVWINEAMAGMTPDELRELQRLLAKLKASVSAVEQAPLPELAAPREG